MVEYEEELKAHLLMSGSEPSNACTLGDEDRWST